jgi:hypothetical protein
MLLILEVTTAKNVPANTYVRIKHNLEKLGYAVHLRPTDLYPNQIIIEGAENAAEIFRMLNKECAPA